jgi:hypothetical protein
MPPLHPKIIILDNDETTGSYKSLFIIYDFLVKSNAGRHLTLRQVAEIIWDHYFNRKYRGDNIFRPYLALFLKKLVEMKGANKLEYIVMLTNQHTGAAWADSNGKTHSISKLIAEILGLISGAPLWDIILTRDLTAPTVHGYNIKYLSRVFQELGLPVQAWSYKYVWFVDDLAEEPFAQLWKDSDLKKNELPKSFRSISTDKVFQKVSPYRVQISLEDIFLISNKLIHTAAKNAGYLDEYYTYDIEVIKALINSAQEDIYEDLLEEERNGFSSKSIVEGDNTFLLLASKLNDFYDNRANGGARKKGRSRSAGKRQRRITEFIEEPRSSSPRRNNTIKKTS